MSVTNDVDSITNSVLMAMDKEFRKNGIAPASHRHYKGNREVIRALVEMFVLETEAEKHDS